MKLQKIKTREYKGKAYHKYRVNLSEKVVKEAGLKGGDELDVKVVKKGVVRLERGGDD